MSYHSDLDIQMKESRGHRDPWRTERWENFGGDPGYPKQPSTLSRVQQSESTTVRVSCRKCNVHRVFHVDARDQEWEAQHYDHGIEYYFS